MCANSFLSLVAILPGLWLVERMAKGICQKQLTSSLASSAVALALVVSGCSKAQQPESAGPVDELAQELYPKVMALEAYETTVKESAWKKELQGQRLGNLLNQLWDEVNLSGEELDSVATWPLNRVVFPHYIAPSATENGFWFVRSQGKGVEKPPGDWKDWVKVKISDGWKMTQLEMRHVAFDPPSGESPCLSKIYFFAGLTNAQSGTAITLEGPVEIRWTFDEDRNNPLIIRTVDASGLALQGRRGDSLFAMVTDLTLQPLPKTPFIDPLIVSDLDEDGELEIVMAALNQKFHFRNGTLINAGPLCPRPPGQITSALIADFDGDNVKDLLFAKRSGLVFHTGSEEGTFGADPVTAWTADPGLRYALVMTCGDVDGDGDLDVWLTQYKVPYLQGAMPVPYYDANNGYPSYLLLNDGTGRFKDATAGSGLEKKRFRLTYSTSFAHLDGDNFLDLLVVNDFAGIDLYRGDGKGNFSDVTDDWVASRFLTGMAHSIADFDRNSEPDFLAIGMTSPTVDRLEHLNLIRKDSIVDQTMRLEMMHGNRLYLQKRGKFLETDLSRTIQRGGWAWGSTAFDWDNDGWMDVYLANGHETRQSVQDYDSEYWLHDVYVGNGKEDQVNLLYFSAKATATRGRGWSYGGWDRNRLFWNQHGKTFVDLSYLGGASLQSDSRNVVSADLNNDGKLDLLVTTFEAWPEQKQTLKVFLNQAKQSGNWIGVRFRNTRNKMNPMAARVTLRTSSYSTTRQLVTGDSFRSQHPNIIHFGLGSETNVQEVLVEWLNGKKQNLVHPGINQVHVITSRD